MKHTLPWFVLCLLLCNSVVAQDSALVNCGQKEANDRFLRQNPSAKRLHDQIEFQIADYTRKVKAGTIPQQRVNAIITLPVVVHIVHNNGSENISDAQAMTAIQNLNAAFANTGFYDPSNGVNTEIQFCLAQRDPSGNATNGITRNVSPYTVMGGPQYTSDDQNVKNLNRWNPRCYINIWLVRSIPGGVAGYAYLPSAHGSNVDGIVMEAAYFGSSPANDVVIIHEMGHYLGLYHTFDGGCSNTDCTTQGDRVCDTPPDQSTGWAGCNTTVNSCSTDPLSGFGTDVNDLKEDYMDYGNFDCMKVFTQGQKDRMIWHINNVRSSLLNCNSCLSPCPAPVVANFTQSATNVPYGTTVNFTNTSSNASGYRWYVNGVLQSTTTNFSYTFNAGGTFNIRMVALPGSPLCDSVIKTGTVNVVCTAPVTAGFTASATIVPIGTTVNFTNNSTNASTYRWYINGVYQSGAINYSNTFNSGGIYIVRLAAMSNSPICDSSVVQDTIRVDCSIVPGFSPLISTANVHQTLTFTNSSTGATSYIWKVNNVLQGTTTNFSYSFTAAGNYSVKLIAISATCSDSTVGSVVIEDTCARNTFQKSIGGPADDMANDVQSAVDGGYVLAGRTRSYGSGGEDAFIVKVDDGGTPQWSKAYGGSGNDWFNAIVATSDGGYAAVGRTYSYGNAQGDAWIVKTDANGVVQWSRRFDANTTYGEEALAIVQTPDGGYAFTNSYNSSPGVVDIMLIKLDANGNLLWSKVYSSGSTDGAFAITADGNDLLLGGYTRTDASWHDGLLIKINGSNGNVYWTKKYDVAGRNNAIWQVHKHGNGYLVNIQSGQDFTELHRNRNIVLTIDANGNVTNVKEIVAPDYATGLNVLVPMGDGSFVTVHNEDNNASDFNIFRIGANGATQWAKKYPRAGIQINTMFRPSRDGGFISAGYTGTAGNYDIYFLKTDIAGNSPGCDVAPVQVTTNTLPSAVSDFTWSIRDPAFSNMVINQVTTVNAVVPENSLCTGVSCQDPEPPADGDTCNQKSSFQKRYGGTGEDVSIDIIPTRDGGYLSVGHSNSAGAGNADAMAIKFDKSGNVTWSKLYGGAAEDMFQKARQTSDGGYVLGGFSRSYGNNAGDAFIVKTDANGALQWARRYGDGQPNGTRIFDLIQTTDGGYAFAGNHNYSPGVVDIMVVRLDATGTVLWSKGWGTDGSDEAFGIVEDRDSLVVTGIYQSPTFYDGMMMKLDKANGNIAWTKSWDFDNRTNRIASIFFQPDGYLVSGVNSDDFGVVNPYHSLLKTDHNGNILWTKELRTTPNTMNGYLYPTRDGGFVINTIESIYNTSSDIYLTKADRSGNVQWTRRFQNPGMQMHGPVFQTSDRVYVTAGTTNVGGNTDVLLIRTDTTGNTQGCNSTLVTSQLRDPAITPLNFQWPRAFNITFNANITVNPRVSDAVKSVVSQCEFIPCVQPPPDDTCTTRKSFLVSIGGSGKDEALHVINTPDGGNLIVGSSNSNAGSNTDALIARTDNAGKLIWSKTYGGVGADVFERIIPTRDGNYVAIGSGVFKTGHYSDIFIIKIDPNGNLIWSKAYGAGTGSGEWGRSVTETSDGGFAIAADYNLAPLLVNPLFMKLDQNGVLLWSKTLDASGAAAWASDIVAHGDVLFGTGSRMYPTDFRNNDGYIIKIRHSDGAILWTRNIESEGRSNRLQQVKLHKDTLVFTMFNADDWFLGNCIPVVFTTDTSGNVTTGVQFNPDNASRQSIHVFTDVTKRGELVTSVADFGNSGLTYLVKTSGSGEIWTKGYRPAVNPVLRSVVAGSNGYTTVGQSGDAVTPDILLIRVTTDGTITNQSTETDCAASADRVNSVNSVSIMSTPVNYWTGIGTGNLEMINAAPNIIASLLPYQVQCIDSTHCDIPPVDDDTCAITFQKTYMANGGYNAFYINTTSDGGSVIAGIGNPVPRDVTPESTNIDAFVMKLAKSGKLQWAKRFGGTGYDEFRKIRQTSDGGYIAIGSSSSFSANRGIYLVRISAAGNVIWSKNFSANAANRDLGLDVIQTSDGGFVFTATNDAAPPQAHGIVAKTDANGNITWHKRLYRNEGVDIQSVIEVGDTLVLGADYWVNADQRYYGAIIKMNKSNGTILQSVSFSADTRSNFAPHVYKTATGYLVGVQIFTDATFYDKNQGIIHFSPGLELEKAEFVLGGDTNPWSDITPTLDSGYVGTAGRYAFGLSFYLHKVNKSGTFDFAMAYGQHPTMAIIMQTAANAQQYPDGKFITVNTYNEPVTGWDGKLHVIKTSAEGESTGCRDNPTNKGLQAIAATVNPVTFTDNTTFNYNPATSVATTTTDVAMYVRDLCETDCVIDSLTGPDSVCNFTDTVTYELVRTGNCTQPVQWTIDTNYARIVSTTTNTIRLLFKQAGTVRLRAVMSSGCEIYSDSMDIHIFDSPDTLNLGPDIAICKISTWPLNARSGFKSYLWQDGSTDSTFTADQPGIYHVTVTDYCGNQLHDTVNITLAPDVPFDLGPDIAICNEDTVTLTAPTGFTNYYWSPSYRVSNSYQRQIRVNPDRDTTYTVVAEKGPGCLVSDTIRVTVNRPLPLDLGVDKAFCRNDSVLLDAGPSFSGYLWNNLLTTQQIYAKTAGTYHVTATDINGCSSSDTVDIGMNELPVVNLGKDTIICHNTGVLFNPGIGNAFNTYLWQDGATSNTYFGTAAGTYWVEVTNADNCKNSDTVKIIRVAELPSDFLADTIGICDGEQIELRAGKTFVSYEWDGLFNTPTITVKDEGGHTLEVMDEYGCVGEDTIRVYFKTCRKRIWFPNAFSPNNDRYNNTFKPVVDGGLVKFHLVIYNRWGQKIFETTDARRGWDGTVSGHTQDTNTFVWVCTYKFIGRDQVEKTEKGTVIVVR